MSSPKRVPMDPPGETSAGRLRQEQSRTHARHHSLQSHHAQTIHTNGNGGRTRHHSLKPYSTQTYATNGSGTESNNPVLPLDRRTQLQSSHSTPQFHHQQLQSQMSSSTFATPAIQQSHSMPVSPTSHRSSYTGPMPTTPTTIHDSAGRSDTDSPSNNHRASSNSSSSSSSPFPFSPHNSQQAFRDREGPSRATEADKSSSLHHHHQQNVDLTKPPTEPGAYRVVKHRPSGTKAYRLVIPPGIGPGQDFVYEINSRRVEVTCPDTAHSGSELEIAVPHAAEYKFYPLKVAQLTASPSMTTTTNTNSSAAMALSGDRRPQGVEGGAYAMIPEIKFINQQALEAGGTVRTHVVTIPDHAVPGATFSVEIGGSRFKVVCPDGTPPGSRIRIVPPPDVPEPEPSFQPFAVQVPEGVKPGGQFAVLVGTQQVLVECPHSAVSGKIVRIKLPTQTVTGNIKMSYPSGSGWIRTIRASDMKFQWVRLHEAIVAVDDTFNFTKSAYVRKLTELEGNDPRLRTASIELVSAEHAVVDSRFKTGSGKLLFSYADIAFQQGKPLAEKHEWFLSMCQQLTDSVSAFENGAACVKIILRREQLVHDSIKAVLSLGSDDLRRNWEFQFVNEPGVDRGGLTKEWFECVTEKLFHPDFALFVSSVNNQAAVDINPSVGKQ